MIPAMWRLKWRVISAVRRRRYDMRQRGTHERRLAYALWEYRLLWKHRHLAKMPWWKWPIAARVFVRSYLRGVPLGWRKE